MSKVRTLLRAPLEQSGSLKPIAKGMMRFISGANARGKTSVARLRSRLAALQADFALRRAEPLQLGVHGDRPPQPIAIFGYDAGTPNLLSAARAVGFEPTFVHAPDGGISGDEIVVAEPGGRHLRVPAVGAEDFRRAVEEKDVPVIMGAVCGGDGDVIAAAIQQSRAALNLSSGMHHPAVLSDNHRNPNQRFAIIGFPGSGNMIVQNVCWRLKPAPRRPFWGRDPVSARVTGDALSYWSALNAELETAFDAEGRWQTVAGPTHMRYGNVYISVRDYKTEVLIAGLPQRSFTWANPWHTGHEPLTAKTRDFFTARNFHILQILRHPLDLVVSNAAKITIASGERVPQLLLQNDRWMDGMLKAVEAYYAGIADHLGALGVSFVRYEALMADPVRTIRHLAEILGVRCTDDNALNIWTELGNKPLASVGHMWSPGAGKWRKFIPPRFSERIRASRLREYAEEAGYRMDAEDFEGTDVEMPSNVCDPMYLAWEEGRWELLTGKPCAIEHPAIYRLHDDESGLLWVGAREYEATMERLRHSKRLEDLLAAGRPLAPSEPPLVADLLGLR